MATVKRFEDLRTWQSARELVNLIYEISGTGRFSKDFGLRDQIRRASGSTMHNLAEGFDSGSDAQFIRYLGYSRSSASEVQSQLYISLDQGYMKQGEFQNIYDLATKLKKQINSLIGYLARGNSNKRVQETSSEYIVLGDEFELAEEFYIVD